MAEPLSESGCPTVLFPECFLVLRRLTALLLMGFFLSGSALPVFACSNPTQTGDCCPEGASLPCTGETGVQGGDLPAAWCCETAPSPTSGASITPTRNHADPDAYPESLDSFASTANSFSPASAFESRSAKAPALAAPRADAALTYLRTSRLRL